MDIRKQRQTLKHLSSHVHRLNFTTKSFSPSFLLQLYYFIPRISPLTLLSQLVSLGPSSEAINRTGGLGQPVVIFLCYSSFLILFLHVGVAPQKAAVPSGNACSSMVSSSQGSTCSGMAPSWATGCACSHLEHLLLPCIIIIPLFPLLFLLFPPSVSVRGLLSSLPQAPFKILAAGMGQPWHCLTQHSTASTWAPDPSTAPR